MSAVYAPPHDPTAVLGRRVVAYLIDWAVPALLFVALFAVLSKSYDKPAASSVFDALNTNVCDTIKQQTNASVCFESANTAFTLTGGAAVLAFGLPVLVSFANLVVLQGARGASAGKMVTNLCVVNEQGHAAGFGRALVRWPFLIIDGLCGVLGLVVAAVTTPHRRIGDFVAGTYVVGRDDVGRPVGAPQAAATHGYAPSSQYTPYTPTAGAATAGGSSAPVWDAQRSAWVSYDAQHNVWLRYDTAAGAWRSFD